ncbi:MAG: aminotransferase class I/II-fold pyridoxal phosphate-dependent enzyme [Deltaproteobacteria bacterium]|nr:aminotransferase class I/II-fold pyridoxal phosphate-dependent enzyme [Deltaproteobacteria bacterium]
MDVFDKCRDYGQARSLRAADVYSYYRPLASAQDPEVTTADGRRLVMLGSNNYLGLTNHPEVKEAAAAALARYGTGCAGSRLLNGSLDLHEELEARLAAFMHREAAVTFSTGFQVNLGTLSCLLGRHDVAILDALDHACILDGCRLGFGKLYKFRHNDLASLEAKLAAVPEDRGRLIVVDGVYSMEGDLAPLPGIVALKQRFGARLMVDDAHGLGVLGASGRGTAEHFGVEGEVDLVMGTFSKSLAAIGGFVAGDATVIDYVRHTARSAVFSAALPPASAAAALAALAIVEREPERRKQLWEVTAYMKRELAGLGFDTGDSESPVIPIIVGDDMRALRMVRRLHEEGVFVNCVISPGVPEDRAMVRTSYMATHQRAHLDRALDAIARVGRELGVR